MNFPRSGYALNKNNPIPTKFVSMEFLKYFNPDCGFLNHSI